MMMLWLAGAFSDMHSFEQQHYILQSIRAAVTVQKLEQLVSLLMPDSHSQRDISTLETIVYKACTAAVESDSVLGQVLQGPTPAASQAYKLPATFPLWQKGQLEKKKSFRLSNHRRLTTDCLQASSAVNLGLLSTVVCGITEGATGCSQILTYEACAMR